MLLPPKTTCSTAYFRCERCSAVHEVLNDNGRVSEPEKCEPGCGSKWTCALVHNMSTFINKQLVKMQVWWKGEWHVRRLSNHSSKTHIAVRIVVNLEDWISGTLCIVNRLRCSSSGLQYRCAGAQTVLHTVSTAC